MPTYKKKSTAPNYNTNSYEPDSYDNKKEELEPCVKFVIDSWDDWNNYWGDKLNKFEEYYNRWKNKPPEREEQWQSTFQKRLTWQAVATLSARYHSMLFPVSAPIEAEATETQDEFYRILSKSLVGHWFKLGKITSEFLKAIRSAGIYGTGFLEDDWYIKTGRVIERVEQEIPDFRPMVDLSGNKVLDEEGNIRSEQVGFRKIFSEEPKEKIVEDRYRVRKSSIFSWRVHPYKKNDDDDFPVIKQEFVTFEALKDMELNSQRFGYSKFENMDRIEQDKFSPNEQEYSRINKDNNDFTDKKNPRIELLHYWGLYSEGDKKKTPSWIIVANRKYKISLKNNPFWHQKPPLMKLPWIEDDKESYYGIGIAEVGKDAEDRANTTVNIRIDERKKSVRGGGWYNANDKKINKKTLQKNVPGLWKGCSDVNASVRPDPPMPKSTLDDYKEEETAVNDHREAVGATTSMLPTADIGQQHKTLGGMELLASQGLQRLKPDLAMMEINGIRRVANRAFLMTRQFMSLPQTIELIASESQLKQLNLTKVYTVEPEKLISGVNFFCTGLSESVDKIQNIDKALKFMEILQKTTPGNPFIFYLIKKIALWLGFEDAEEAINSLQAMPPMMPGMPQGGMPGLPPGMPMPAGMPLPIAR